MPKIENVSLYDIECGNHMEANNKTILIQIVDPDVDFPKPTYNFSEIYKFKFLDLEKNADYGHHLKITKEQTKEIAKILKKALAESQDIIVHCMAGVCRSGAVCEVGIILGFEDMFAYRSPNLFVKHNLLEELGLPYDSNEQFSENGRFFYYDELNNKIYYDETENNESKILNINKK